MDCRLRSESAARGWRGSCCNGAKCRCQQGRACCASRCPGQCRQVEPVDILKQNQAERSRDQPGNLAPTYRIVVEGRKNYSSLPAREAGILIQPKAQFFGQPRATTAGEAWRQYLNGPLTKIGGWLLLFTLLVLGAIYLFMGQVKLKEKRYGASD